MGRPRVLSAKAEAYIREHHEEMPARIMAQKLGVTGVRVNNFLYRQGLTSRGERGYYKEKKKQTPDGMFNVNEFENWIF